MPNVIEITDFSAPELDVYARLTEAQLLNRFEPAKGMFIAESPKVIHRALDGGCEPVSMLMERKDIEGSAAEILARCPEIPVREISLRTTINSIFMYSASSVEETRILPSACIFSSLCK